MNYFDILLAKKLEDDRDPKVEGLSVTKNGRYHEEGVVYDPVIVALPLDDKTITANGTYKASDDNLEGYDEVIVNVPLPENAYLLKDIPNTPTAIATFSDGANLPMPKLEVGIEPIQDLHGYDAPWVGGAGKNKCDYDTYLALYKIGENSFSGDSVAIAGKKYYFPQELVGKTVTFSAYIDLSGLSTPNRYSVYALIDNTRNNNGNDITAGSKGYSSVTVVPTSTDDYVSFTYGSGRETIKLKDLQIEINGSRTDWNPYSNICPISGWDEVNVVRAGKNLAENVLVGGSIGGTGVIGTASGYSMAYGKVKKGVTYTITTNDLQLVGGFFENEPQIGAQSYDGSRLVQASKTFTAPIDGYIAFRILENYTQYQLEIGLTATTYTPYNGTTYTIDLDGTRYGGKVDLVSGVLTLTDGFIASYNDEALPSTWISDRDVYAEGTTPTIGAEVCYKLATPLTIQLPTTVVKSLDGVNNVWADSGNVLDGEYFAEL